MKRTLIGGVALALVAAAAVYVGDALNLGLSNPLLGVGLGGALAFAPGEHKMGRLAGFLLGVLVALIGYAVSAGFMPASNGGAAVVAVVTIALATVVSVLGFGRMPFWSVLMGVAGFVGAYHYIYDDKPYDFLTSAPATLGAFLVTFGLGYLVAALVDLLVPDDESGEQPQQDEELVSVGSEG